ncbi:MAG: LON peptidase substrate-binding domain-containing protein [Chloroflexi bacterium]|nr:LON peptidase substrate-binding domain-containing protein [Chloroflexota bacterium]
MDDSTRVLPLFPLNTVLFPGVPLPLHVFEERYRLMIGTCIVTDNEFGVALIREGVEVGGPAVPYDVGTIARIVDVERMPDGRMNLLTMGMERYRLLSVVQREPYLSGRVEVLPSSDLPAGSTLVDELVAGFRAYADDLPGRLPPIERANFADDPDRLAFQIAAALGLSASVRQALLEIDSTTERLEKVQAHLRREHQNVRLFTHSPSTPMSGPFSLN